MAASEKDQSEQMQQAMGTEDQNIAVKLFTEETFNSLTKADSDEMIHQLN